MTIHYLARRGVEMASDHFSNPDNDLHVSAWLLALGALTSLALMLAMWAVRTLFLIPCYHYSNYANYVGRLHLWLRRRNSRCRRRYQPRSLRPAGL